MKCYNHHQVDAVGICKNCSKGICTECLVDVGNGIACKSTCEQEVRNINQLINRNKESYRLAGNSYLRNSIYMGLLGIIFISFGLYENNSGTNFSLCAGIIFLLGTAIMIYTGLKYKKK